MSEIEEPPAKVLKIDSIDGVTHVTEVEGLPEDYESVLEEHEIMDQSGVIEGGADIPDIAEEGQEEWLSEGILTDDDFNPASQDIGTRTDSQLETSPDEENPNDSMEQLDTTADSEVNMTREGANEDKENEEDARDVNNEENMAEHEEHLEDMEELEADGLDGNMESQTYTQPDTMDCGTNNAETKTSITETETNITQSVANIVIQANVDSNLHKKELKPVEQNIEETMKHLDRKQGDDGKNDAFDSLLVQNTEVKTEHKVKFDIKPEQDDGNDTDDLLRMLSEDNNKTKKLTKTVKDIRSAVKDIRSAVKADHPSSDDDEFVYEGTSATMKKLKAVKTALAKKQPAARAEPEDMEDGDDEHDMSADELLTLKKIFGFKKKSTPNNQHTPAPAPRPAPTPHVVVKQPPKNIVNVIDRPPNMQAVKTQSKPLKQYQNKRLTAKSILKPPTPKSVAAMKAQAVEMKSVQPTFKPPEVKTPVPFKSASTLQSRPGGATRGASLGASRGAEPDETIHKEEFLDEDEFDLDEDEFGESDFELSKNRQRIMRPELMDEEVPSDGESHSEDGSLYDELPSSGSEDMDDWFQLDIRAEKAGDYLPLLGSKAKDLLLEEKRRVSSRLQTLKQSLSALTESGKKQAEQLRDATMSLAELDDMLKAS